ncbi:hypothetical protein HN371_20545 [Candidatus Poribacteria bacterium]|jgi:hypothetical protein|nr:hypothetical protein [Candidatus Poribacteria bacterium]MBT5534418.1 hypothetical protein [Candidatus Poribacteria bacterium]MBT5709584.1 hypothetical protein [Candidatus Poribacteria bacterium]MBT7101096.1 hypothetical protein [Candidatus Poribacteria bacterium]MBT7807545.1 hypothetical protein [Candidatus Poribacteria bacterium]
MAVSRADLEALVRELPEAEIGAAYEALRGLLARDSQVAREARRQKLRDAGLLVHAATGALPRDLDGYDPPVMTDETMADAVIKNRE